MSDREWVVHVLGWRVRLYVGASLHRRRRVETYRTDLGTRGVFLVPWAVGPDGRVFGIQWRRVNTERRDTP